MSKHNPRAVVIVALLLLTACGRHKEAKVNVPPPVAAPSASPGASPGGQPAPSGDNDRQITEGAPALRVPLNAPPLLVETGIASWYGAPFHNRRGSNGELYNMHAMTAAHRTLPLGSVARVTNVKTGHSAIVRITDRGPFIPGRLIDLSFAAAKQIDVWQPGTATVRVEVLSAPAPLDSGGRWAVQIGGFPEEPQARELADHLSRRYRTAKILSFNSPAGEWWVRVRVQGDDRKRAEEIASVTQTPQGAIFLVRLD